MVEIVNILGTVWAGYIVVRLETLASSQRDLRRRVRDHHGEDD